MPKLSFSLPAGGDNGSGSSLDLYAVAIALRGPRALRPPALSARRRSPSPLTTTRTSAVAEAEATAPPLEGRGDEQEVRPLDRAADGEVAPGTWLDTALDVACHQGRVTPP